MLGYEKVPASSESVIAERIDKVKGNMNVDNIYTDEGLGELLNTVVKGYFAQLDSYNSIISDMNKVKSTRLLSAGMTGYDPKVSYMFNSPTEIREGSLYIDVDKDIHSLFTISISNKSIRRIK